MKIKNTIIIFVMFLITLQMSIGFVYIDNFESLNIDINPFSELSTQTTIYYLNSSDELLFSTYGIFSLGEANYVNFSVSNQSDKSNYLRSRVDLESPAGGIGYVVYSRNVSTYNIPLTENFVFNIETRRYDLTGLSNYDYRVNFITKDGNSDWIDLAFFYGCSIEEASDSNYISSNWANLTFRLGDISAFSGTDCVDFKNTLINRELDTFEIYMVSVSPNTKGHLTIDTDNIIITSNSTTNQIPIIISTDYETDPILNNVIYINSTATDNENDDIYWAYDCDYSSISEDRVAEEYFNFGENETEIMTKFNIDYSLCGSDSFQISYIDSLIGYAWNISQSSCVTPFFINMTDSNGLDANSITTHALIGFNNYLSTENNGVFFGGFDESGFLLFAIGVNFNGTTNQNTFYRMKETDTNFTYLTTNNNIPDRILVDIDLSLNKYRIRIDDTLDGTIDYVSDWYQTQHIGSSYLHDVAFFTLSKFQENIDYFDLVINAPLRNVFIDTIYTDYVDTPSFSLTPSNTFEFNCTYGSIGNYDMRLWVTDDNHFNNYTSYIQETLQVVLPTQVDCTGFIEPICNIDEIFCDDFSYTNPIECNGWSGTGFSLIPDSGELHINEIDPYHKDIILQLENTISSSQYNNYELSFDFTINNTETYIFNIVNEIYSKYSLYMQWDNYQLIAYDNIAPTQNNLGTFNQGQKYNFKSLIDYENQKIAYYIDDIYVTQSDFFDDDVQDSFQFQLYWITNNEDISIDNFIITSGEINSVYTNTTPTTIVDYVYNPEIFGAINWSSGTGKFDKQNCIDRGYPMNDSRAGLCLPKAFISDTVSWIYYTAIENILITIIIVLVLILLIPLIIAGRK